MRWNHKTYRHHHPPVVRQPCPAHSVSTRCRYRLQSAWNRSEPPPSPAKDVPSHPMGQQLECFILQHKWSLNDPILWCHKECNRCISDLGIEIMSFGMRPTYNEIRLRLICSHVIINDWKDLESDLSETSSCYVAVMQKVLVHGT